MQVIGQKLQTRRTFYPDSLGSPCADKGIQLWSDFFFAFKNILTTTPINKSCVNTSGQGLKKT